MSDPAIQELETIGKRWDAALHANDYGLALEVAKEGYRAATAHDLKDYRLMFLGFIRHAGAALFDELSSRKETAGPDANECSFCKKRKERLVRGLGVAICADCIESARSVV